ncbi:SspB family protein [Humitalea sp. 24SJ18S-53]|uniref:SspB family protein n=1 Tax=Humitalea sp. 24SJ18S-53 TaxID=3422307 RepID=UPI003D67A4B1
MNGENIQQAESLLPYDVWTEEASREVMIRALEYGAKHGLPGEHHFYVTFRTTHPSVNIPGHLRARYPEEMTIVLQHQFWDLKVDRTAKLFSVGLSFGQVPSTLVVPFAAVTAFWDPCVRIGLRFGGDEAAGRADADAQPEAAAPVETPEADSKPQVVQLDAFRRKPARD